MPKLFCSLSWLFSAIVPYISANIQAPYISANIQAPYISANIQALV